VDAGRYRRNAVSFGPSGAGNRQDARVVLFPAFAVWG